MTARLAFGPASLSMLLAALALALAAILIGEPLRALLTQGAPIAYDPQRLVLLYATLPRLAMALLCGGALAASGAILQQALRNPLASPTTLGIDTGARLALSLATLFAPALVGLGRDLTALAGSAAATALVFALTRRQGFAPVPMVLAGLVVSLYCGVLSALLVLFESRYLVSLFIWGSGSLSQQSWEPAAALSLRLAILAPFALLLVRPLRLLDLGDGAARGLGLPVPLLRFCAVALAMAVAAFVTASVGIIGFVGLVAPLVAGLCGARDFGARLFWSVVIGALLLLLTDLGVQLLAGAAADLLPTGAVTAVLGSPILLWLLPRLAPMGRPGHVATVRRERRRGLPASVLWIAALAVLAGLVALALFLGRAPGGEWRWLAAKDYDELLPWRAPRILAAGAAGALLALAGLTLQRLTGNEMASPEILGVSAGATFAVGVALFVVAALSPAGELVAATLGCLAVLALILAFGRRTGFSPERVLLAGIAINALLDAVIGVLSATGDPRAILLLSWMAGSTSGMEAIEAWRAAVLAGFFAIFAVVTARFLAILPLGAPQARALGVPVRQARFLLLLLTAGATAAATPLVGPLTFVGLMAPHIVRMAGVRRALPAIAASALCGAALLIAADWLARVALHPFQLPTGLVAALVGAPFLLWLLQARETTR